MCTSTVSVVQPMYVVLYLRSIETETQGAQTKTDGRQFLEIAQVKVSF